MTTARLISEAVAGEGLPRTGDVLAVGLPLLRQIDGLHQLGLVADLRSSAGIDYDGVALRLVDPTGVQGKSNDTSIARCNPAVHAGGIEIRSRTAVEHEIGQAGHVTSRDVHLETSAPTRPMYLVGYRAWEQAHRHHDPRTDMYLCGLFLISFAAGLDLGVEADVHELALNRGHLGRLAPQLHPVVLNVLEEMVDPDRHRRPPEMNQVIARLEHHRELPQDLDLSVAYEGDVSWQQGVLSTLRNRVFDTTRRNRALYFRPSATTVSLTEASVPLLLNIERISPDDLFTWNSGVADKLRSGKRVDIEQWCRLEDAPHVAPALDKLISNERKLRTESGHGRLRLIVAFLRWFDREANEVVNSPFVIVPVDLAHRKGVRKRYTVAIAGDAAVNPIVRFVFKDRFDIDLPEFIEPDVETIKQLGADLERQVRGTDPAVGIDIIEKPRIDLLRRRAQLRVDNFRRRRARTQAATGRWRRTDHSYTSEDWRPLGLALYDRFVVPHELPLRGVAGAPPRVRSRPQGFTGTATSSGATRESESFSVATGDVDGQRWELDLCAVTLAMLGTRRTSLSRDYDELLSRTAAGDTFDGTPFGELFAPVGVRAHVDDVASISIDQQLVLPADDAQAKAVRRAVRGDSFIIQGPPGTGKSQTITNLIAALVAEGKRVLFVCEKRAALDVVGHRLRQVGLGDLVATIHDSQLDRKAFVMSLGETYNTWIDESADTTTDRASALARVQATIRPLEVLVTEFGRPRFAEQSVRQLVERSVLLRASGAVPAVAGPATLPEWFTARRGLDLVTQALSESGQSPVLGTHPCLFARPAAIAAADPVASMIDLGREITQSLDEFEKLFADVAGIDDLAVRDLREVGDFAIPVEAAAASPHPAALDPATAAHLDLRASAQAALVHADQVAQSTGLANWNPPLNDIDARNALEIAEKHEGSFFKFLNRSWRSVKTLVEQSYDFSAHQVRPPISGLLRQLVDHHDLVAGLEQAQRVSMEQFGAADPSALVALVDQYQSNPLFGLLARSSFSSPGLAAEVVASAARVGAVVDALLIQDTRSLAQVATLGRDMTATSVVHERALVRWTELTHLQPELLGWVIASGASIAGLELVLVDQALAQTLSETVGTMRSGTEIDAVVSDVLECYRELLDSNAASTRESVGESFRAAVAHSEASMAGRSDQDKDLKKRYKAGRRVLEREFSKKMRYRAIRELADGDTGLVVRDLRPIWLMSPLSVSDTLPLDDSMFDAVVFDEASQIPVEDAVPSIFRSNQVIVVGDRMQLPPTRFFSAGSDGDDELEVVDDGTRITLALDADSFLTQADEALSSSMLTWHYRSRSESLIAYSNRAFYGGELATVPDRVTDEGELSAIDVEDSGQARANASAVLDRPISFHRMQNGIYRNRSNDEEADYIAELVRELLHMGTGQTIGIVAFSEAQQNAIETSLTELATLDNLFAEALETERNRTEDGEFMGLFVKNLENVQGDERDIIIMSVCYGPGEDGRVRMNFGPINQPGGERRLNVIFSRAKHHMAIVSSMDGHHITNTHNDGAAHLANFLTYAAAESIGADEHSAAILASQAGVSATPAAARSAIAQQLVAGLRVRGWAADADVGRSKFRLDAAVQVHGRYVVGVLIDPDESSTATARFVAEAGVLQAFGWRTIRVTPTEWWSDSERVIERLDHELRRITDR